MKKDEIRQLLANVIDYITITLQFSWLHYITITSIFKCNRLNYNHFVNVINYITDLESILVIYSNKRRHFLWKIGKWELLLIIYNVLFVIACNDHITN
jgi:hypothetical protein